MIVWRIAEVCIRGGRVLSLDKELVQDCTVTEN